MLERHHLEEGCYTLDKLVRKVSSPGRGVVSVTGCCHCPAPDRLKSILPHSMWVFNSTQTLTSTFPSVLHIYFHCLHLELHSVYIGQLTLLIASELMWTLNIKWTCFLLHWTLYYWSPLGPFKVISIMLALHSLLSPIHWTCGFIYTFTCDCMPMTILLLSILLTACLVT